MMEAQKGDHKATLDRINIRVKDRVGWIKLDHPPVNVLTTAMMRVISTTVCELDTNPDVALIAVSAEGNRAFSAGADVGEHTEELEIDHHDAMFAMIETLRGNGKPRVAVVPAGCYGGGNELAFACDLVIASRKAKFAVPEVKLGVVNAIGARLMMAHAGPANAIHLALSGDSITAEDAHRMGLVVKLFDAENFAENSEAYLAGLATRSAAALLVGREILQQSVGLPTGEAIAFLRHKVAERAMQIKDYAEGMAAFREKRLPVWSDR